MIDSENNKFLPLKGLNVVSLATNLPGPLAMAELRRLGASVIKVEPRDGDPLSEYSPEWYRILTENQQIIFLDLKDAVERKQFDQLLETADLLLTSMRLSALERLSLSWTELHTRFPKLSQVAIVGYPYPKDNVSGHDLTYQAAFGLLSPPHLPKTLLSDLAAAEMAVSAALSLFFNRERTGNTDIIRVKIAEAAEKFAAPLRYGLTTNGSLLGGGDASYNIYQTAQGWIAVAALEPHFRQRLTGNLKVPYDVDKSSLERIFLKKTAAEWQTWAELHDIPLVAVADKYS